MLAWTAMPLLVAPIAGGFADKLGNRPFMIAGLLLQGVSLAWIAAVAAPGAGYGAFIVPLILGCIGIAMCLPTTINLVFASGAAERCRCRVGREQLGPRARRCAASSFSAPPSWSARSPRSSA